MLPSESARPSMHLIDEKKSIESFAQQQNPEESQITEVNPAINEDTDQGFTANRILHSRAGRAVTAFTVALSLGGVADLGTGGNFASAANSRIRRPMKPIQAVRGIYAYFANEYPGLNLTINAKSDTVRPHQLVMRGVCNPNQTWLPNAKDVVDSPGSLNLTDCARNLINGKYQQQRIPRKQMPENERNISYAPLLNNLGKTAAQSVGIPSDSIGTTQYAYTTPKEFEANYSKNNTAPVGLKQIKGLRLLIVRGQESVKITWYKNLVP